MSLWSVVPHDLIENSLSSLLAKISSPSFHPCNGCLGHNNFRHVDSLCEIPKSFAVVPNIQHLELRNYTGYANYHPYRGTHIRYEDYREALVEYLDYRFSCPAGGREGEVLLSLCLHDCALTGQALLSGWSILVSSSILPSLKYCMENGAAG